MVEIRIRRMRILNGFVARYSGYWSNCQVTQRLDGAVFTDERLKVEVHGTLCLKKRPTFTTCYNFYIHSSIATIFGTNVAEKISNQNVLYFPTTSK